MPKISIIVPVYNVEHYLPRCIDSLLHQSIQDIEVILVNDGSTDTCKEICDIFAQKDSRIVVIHKKNGGLSDARNTGLTIAKGEYVGFVDSDDWVDLSMYEVLYNLCIQLNSDISTCLIKNVGKNKKQKNRASNKIEIYDSQKAIHSLYKGTLSGFSACNKIYKKKLFKNIEFPKGRVYEDAAVMYRLFNLANKIVFINAPLYMYEHRENSITRSNFSEKRFDIVPNYYETYSFMKKNYPDMCERLNAIYFSSLRNMIVDIVCEKNIVKNSNHILRVSKLIRNSNKVILRNNSLSVRHKLFAQILAWCPWLGVLMYQLRMKINYESYTKH
ncbi:glycosyltransferase family 2 protein [Jeotgalibacillus soli]|uniref:Glycosyltransferase 2-like domain-containing protein n=1 Tax=Jeotgalibacillus soli TaxID=889306 RepID=A0A0C2VY67_9BACL|nr:glycosyltransferase [Jeotgalibacillus soli]KIL49366.1 hypothetical protein KP78_08340 [Jeotgalibacillus soli]